MFILENVLILHRDSNENKKNKQDMTPKKRAVVSYENMSEELAAAFAEKFPRGERDYFSIVKSITKPDGSTIHTVELELPDAIYLVKVQMKMDDAEDLERWLDADDADDEESGEGDTLPDDNIAQYSEDESGE